MVADTLSRIEVKALVTNQPPKVNFEAIAEAQSTDNQLRALQTSPTTTLVIEAIPLANSSHLQIAVTLFIVICQQAINGLLFH